MDEDQLGALIETIYASAFEEGGWDHVLHSVRTEFHASQITQVEVNRKERVPSFISSTIAEPTANNRYRDYYCKLDPTYPGLLSDRWALDARINVFRQDELGNNSQFLRSEFFCDFTRHFDMGRGLYAIINNTNHLFGNFHIHRPLSSEDFTNKELERLTALVPHLNRGLQIYRELGALRGRAGLFETAFGALGAAFLLDASGRVLMLNKGAGQLLEDGGVLSLVDGRLGARYTADDAVLAAAFAPSRPGAAPAGIVLRGGATAAGLQLDITPVKGRNIPMFANAMHGEQVAFMVTATALGPSLQNLMALHGLTRAEAEVALLLSEGLRAPQIAAHRETSIATVNTQLKQIYAKTGVDGQIALILKLLGR